MKNILLIALLVVSFSAFSQIRFENGYFIDTTGIKTACLIKNMDWKSTPELFQYKLSETSEIKEVKASKVSEIEISGKVKYIRALVGIDRSSENLKDLSKTRNEELIEESILLKVLVEGDASLYSYATSYIKKYFYSLQTEKIEQLIFKSYYTNTYENAVAKNNRYKQQILNHLKCDLIDLNDVNKLQYKENDLTNFFVKYNQCKNQSFVNYKKRNKTKQFFLYFRPGISTTELSIDRATLAIFDIQFENKLTFRVGLEAEILLPFNKNKWGIIVEPTYQGYSSESKFGEDDVRVTYNSFNVPIGLRHHIYPHKDFNIFLNLSYAFRFDLNSRVEFDTPNKTDLTPRRNAYMNYGLGVSFKNKYSLELRYNNSTDTFFGQEIWDAETSNLSLILGVAIF